MANPFIAAEKFATEFRRTEYALKRSRYLRKDREVAEADWDSLARDLGKPFYDHVVAVGIAKTLIGKPPRRLLSTMEWSPVEPKALANVAQLMINGICRVRNSYIHGEKFTGGPEGQWDRDAALISEAHAVLIEALAFLNQQKEAL
jgi:hypothetical protein